ncbi:hypothetical protein SPAN111604_07950 [Sphingomonas antarctica]|uniref:hypothetical protein n=1 Tax=Sphingomonas antarctica TaxID=2040274 RepID=UPI0039EC7EEC
MYAGDIGVETAGASVAHPATQHCTEAFPGLLSRCGWQPLGMATAVAAETLASRAVANAGASAEAKAIKSLNVRQKITVRLCWLKSATATGV